MGWLPVYLPINSILLAVNECSGRLSDQHTDIPSKAILKLCVCYSVFILAAAKAVQGNISNNIFLYTRNGEAFRVYGNSYQELSVLYNYYSANQVENLNTVDLRDVIVNVTGEWGHRRCTHYRHWLYWCWVILNFWSRCYISIINRYFYGVFYFWCKNGIIFELFDTFMMQNQQHNVLPRHVLPPFATNIVVNTHNAVISIFTFGDFQNWDCTHFAKPMRYDILDNLLHNTRLYPQNVLAMVWDDIEASELYVDACLCYCN